MMKIILGSVSPRRQQLLKAIFGDIEVRGKDIDENFPEHLKAEQVALYLAEKKAKAYDDERTSTEIIITADTIVWLDDHVLNKPADESEALQMLKKLSGRSHRVFTGVCVASVKEKKCFSVESKVWFRKLSEEALIQYIRRCQPFDKAGSYGAQECLPEGLNPLSEEEKIFLLEINKPDLFKKSLSANQHSKIALIEKIEGSYFNVMGLPIAELYPVLLKLMEE